MFYEINVYKISQNSQENTYAGVRSATLFKKKTLE